MLNSHEFNVVILESSIVNSTLIHKHCVQSNFIQSAYVCNNIYDLKELFANNAIQLVFINDDMLLDENYTIVTKTCELFNVFPIIYGQNTKAYSSYLTQSFEQEEINLMFVNKLVNWALLFKLFKHLTAFSSNDFSINLKQPIAIPFASEQMIDILCWIYFLNNKKHPPVYLLTEKSVVDSINAVLSFFKLPNLTLSSGFFSGSVQQIITLCDDNKGANLQSFVNKYPQGKVVYFYANYHESYPNVTMVGVNNLVNLLNDSTAFNTNITANFITSIHLFLKQFH